MVFLGAALAYLWRHHSEGFWLSYVENDVEYGYERWLLPKLHFSLQGASRQHRTKIYGVTREVYNIQDSSLFLIPPRSVIRKRVVRLIDSKTFERLVLLVILLNSIALAIDTPDNADNRSLQSFLNICDYVFTILFTIEAILKIVAHGFIMHPDAYLRNVWNGLDFTIVCAGFTSFLPNAANVSVLRLLRVLRPLRSISRVKGMRVIMDSLILSTPMMVDVVLLLMFFIFIFASFGLELWNGVMHQRCYTTSNSGLQLVANWSIGCIDDTSCMNGVTVPQVCAVDLAQFKFEVFNFDNIGSALLLVFKVISLDDWPSVQHALQHTVGFYSFAYYFLVTIFGAFFCVNLILAILTAVFSVESNDLPTSHASDDPSQFSYIRPPESFTIAQMLGGSAMFLPMIAFVSDRARDHDSVQHDLPSPRGHQEEGAHGFKRVNSFHHSGPSPKSRFSILEDDDDHSSGSESGRSEDETEDQRASIHNDSDINLKKIVAVEQQPRVEYEQGGLRKITSAGTNKSYRTESSTPISYSSRTSEQPKSEEVESAPHPETRQQLTRYQKGHKLLKWMQVKCRHISETAIFSRFMMIVTVGNVVIMSLDSYPSQDYVASAIDQGNSISTYIFTAECFFRMFALTPRLYFKEGFNILDFLLVVISLPDVLQSGNSAFTAFRVFRLARVARAFRLIRRFDNLRKLLLTIISSLGSVTYLSLIMCLFIFIYSILGLQLFGSNQDILASWQRNSRFNSLANSAITVFIVITGENWSLIMENVVLKSSYFACIYFITLFAFGNFVLINLFIAILIDNFEKNNDHGDVSEAASRMRNAVEDEPTTNLGELPQGTDNKRKASQSNEDLVFADFGRRSQIKNLFLCRAKVENRGIKELTTTLQRLESLSGVSLFLFSSSNFIRVGLSRVVFNKFFEPFIIGIISVNVLFLAIDDATVQAGSTLSRILKTSNYVFTGLFTMEMILKIIVHGLVFTPHAYLKTIWNRVDFLVVVSSIIGLGFPGFTLVRSLRAIRIVIRSQNIKVVVVALLQAIPQIINVIVVCLFIWVVFGILGVQLFKGGFYSCNDSTVLTLQDCKGYFAEVNDQFSDASMVMGAVKSAMNGYVLSPQSSLFAPDSSLMQRTANISSLLDGPEVVWTNRVWQNSVIGHFDNIIAAMLALFVIAIGERWTDAMFLGVDSRGPGLAPIEDSRPYLALFYVAFVLIGQFFAMNLFIGLLIDRFNSLQKELEGSVLLTAAQREWVRNHKVLMRVKLKPRLNKPSDIWKRRLHTLVTKSSFEHFITGAILLNMCFMSITTYNMPEETKLVLTVSNIIFTVIFVSEAIMKIYSHTFSLYIKDDWNKFDFIIVLLSLVGSVFGEGFRGASVIRVFRVARVFRLVKKAKGLQRLFQTLLYSIPSLANIGLLLLVTFFIFGVIGVELFGQIPHRGELTDMKNFETLLRSVVALYEVSTTETWVDTMNSVMRPDGCTSKECGVAPLVAILYFVVFVVSGSVVTLNLFITVVLDNFNEAQEDIVAQDRLKMFDEFREQWLHYDPGATHRIPAAKLIVLLRALPLPPEGVGFRTYKEHQVLRALRQIPIPINSKLEVNYTSVLNALAHRVFDMKQDDLRAVSRFTRVVQYKSNVFTVEHYFAFAKLKALFTTLKRKRNLTGVARAAKSSTQTGPDSFGHNRKARLSLSLVKAKIKSISSKPDTVNHSDSTLSSPTSTSALMSPRLGGASANHASGVTLSSLHTFKFGDGDAASSYLR